MLIAFVLAFASLAQAQDEFPDVKHMQNAVKSYQDGFPVNAREKMELAAAWGNKDAQLAVATMYYNGDGAPKDLVMAYAWASVAAERGEGSKVRVRDQIAAELSPDQMQAAKSKSAELKESHGDIAALEKRERWVRKQIASVTGSRTGSGANTVRMYGRTASGGVSGTPDTARNYRERLDNYVQELRDVVADIQYGELEVIEPESDQS